MSSEGKTVGEVARRSGWMPAEWAFRAVVVLGLAANLWMQTHYVTVDRYERDQATQREHNAKLDATMVSLDKSLVVLVEQQKTQAIQDAQLADHEKRLRALEAVTRGTNHEK